MKTVTSGGYRARRDGFTMAELVAVIAVAALIGLILLPALGHARQVAQAVSCQTTLLGFGQGMQTYAADNEDAIPGVNTSGVAVAEKSDLAWANPGVLGPHTLPVQNWDWMTPVLQDDPNLPDNRAARFHYLYSEYRCPEQPFLATVWSGSNGPDIAELRQYTWPACSYLMPAFFQWFGQVDGEGGRRILGWVEHPGVPVQRPIFAKVAPTTFEVRVDNYSPRVDQVGPPARKIFAADGTRYFDPLVLVINIDASVISNYGGAFGSLGAWWAGDTAYGVKIASQNWCGQTLAVGSSSSALNLLLSYRHKLVPGVPQTAPAGSGLSGGVVPGGPVNDIADEMQPLPVGTAQNNRGYMNAVFFDGHVERMNDRRSREIELWYPTGGIVQTPADGMTCVPMGMVIP
jgi:prepilin-type processing-associated H-X9-DG protein